MTTPANTLTPANLAPAAHLRPREATPTAAAADAAVGVASEDSADVGAESLSGVSGVGGSVEDGGMAIGRKDTWLGFIPCHRSPDSNSCRAPFGNLTMGWGAALGGGVTLSS